MTTYMNTAKARMAAQMLVSSVLSAMGPSGAAVGSAAPGVMPAACDGALAGSGSCGCGARDISFSRYQLPMPNTAKYTMTKATSECANRGRRQR